mgnify:CR=1 FL=1
MVIELQDNASMCKSNSDRTKQTVLRSWCPGRITLRYFFLLVLLLSCLPFLLPKFINNDYIRHKALGLIGQDLGRHMDVDHIAMSFFPRPGFRLDGIAIHPDDTITIGIETAFLFPDIGTLLSRTPFPLTGELILKQMSLVSAQNTPATSLPLPLEPFNGSTLKSLAMHFSYTSLQHFALTIRGSHLRISPKTHPEHTLYARSLNAEIKKNPEIISILIDPIGFDPPDMLLGIGFHRNNASHTSQLNFTGHKISVSPLRAMASTFLKKSTIATTLFHIVRQGTIPHITVNFQNYDDKFLFDPQKMIINAELQGGTIAIPSTPLIATDVTAMVQVKDGILCPQISRGTVEEAQLKQGTLQVNLLDKNHAFKGKFPIKVNLEKLPGVLKSLLPGTPLSRELDLAEKIAGSATGTLELTQTGRTLKVAVHCKNIDVTGSYQRFPGNTFQLQAKAFFFDKDKITFKEVKGTIGPCRISQISGEINLGAPHFFDITSGQGMFPIQSTLNWLTQFHPVRPLVAPFSTSQGNLTLDHMTLKGALSAPTQWDYAVQGTCARGSLYQEAGENSISDISFSFDLFPHGFTLENIMGTIHNMDLVLENSHTNGFTTPQRQLFRDLQPPITLTNATLKKTDQDFSFQCQITFPRGISMAMTGTGSNQHTILEKLEIKHSPLSLAEISHHPGSPLTFKGKLNIETIRNLFTQNSGTAAALSLGENKGECFLASGPGKGVTLFLDHLDMNTLLACTGIKGDKNLHPETDLNIPVNTALHTKKNTPKIHQSLKTKDKGTDNKDDNGARIPHVDMIPRPMHVNVGTFAFNSFLISPLALQIFPLPTGTDVAIQESRCCGLPITGVIRKEAKTLKLTLETDAQDLDFTTTLGCFMENHHLIEGKYALKAKLFSMFRGNDNPETQLITGFQGPFELYAQNGRIFQMTLLSRILSLINVSNLLRAKLPDLVQQGFAYDTMIFKGEIKESRIFIKKGVINGVDMTLLITGWIDPVGKTMDILCFVSPLKSVDDLIQKLPIINTMLQGDLISIPITVKGNLYDPEVMALSPVEVTKGIFNTLKDILTTPLTLLKKLP